MATIARNERASIVDIVASQRDECDSMAAIFGEDFIDLSQDHNDSDLVVSNVDIPVISYAIRLDYCKESLSSSSSSWSLYDDDCITNYSGTLSKHHEPSNCCYLAITYPPDYPHYSIPIFHIHYNCSIASDSFSKLHPLQEKAIINCAINAAASSYAPGEEGMPCVYDSVLAVHEFIRHGGLDQACMLTLLASNEDCLAYILSYLASSKEDVEAICISLPLIFPKNSSVVKSNVVWKELCARRWKTMWGYDARWNKYLEKYNNVFLLKQRQQPSTQILSSQSSPSMSRGEDERYFWMNAYNYEETDSVRSYLTRQELHSMIFDYREWFSMSLFHNQLENMRDVLPTGLRISLANDVIFSNTPFEAKLAASAAAAAGTTMKTCTSRGRVIQSKHSKLCQLTWKQSTTHDRTTCLFNNNDIGYSRTNDDGVIMGIDMTLPISSSSSRLIDTLIVGRLANWGWELRGSTSIFRALDNRGSTEEARLWEDLTANIIIQKRPDWVTKTTTNNNNNRRTRWETNYREIPDDEDCKMLDW